MKELLSNILIKNKIDKIADMEPRTFKRFIDFVYVAFNEKKANYKKNKFYYVVLFSVNIIRVNLYYFVKRIKGKTDKIDSIKYVFVPCDGMFERFKYLPEFVEYVDYAILYLPPFRVDYIYKNYKYFMDKEEVVIAPKFSFSCISTLFKFIFKYRKLITNTIHEIEAEPRLKGVGIYLFYHLLKYVIYTQFADRLINRIKMNNNKIYFFDNELTPMYIAYIDKLRKLRNKDKTVNIQHGMFSDINSSYLNPLCDYTFTCSEREKKMYIDSGVDFDNLFVVGSPLQSLRRNKIEQENTNFNTNLLVLATSTELEIQRKIQEGLFAYLKNMNIDYRVRLRPGTRIQDWSCFSKFIDRNIITDSRNTLEEDIRSAGIVISFSMDALIECFSLQKKVALIVPCQYNNFYFVEKYDNSEILITSNIGDLGSFINFHGKSEYSYSTQVFIANNFGEYRFNKVKALYQRVIKEIESK